MSNGRGVPTIAVCLANAQPAACAASRSPAKTPVIALSRLSVTLTRNVPPAPGTPQACATSITSSQIGLPFVTPQVALGAAIMPASWLPSTVRCPAIPGMSALPPPEKPAKKCGSMNPVRIFTSQAATSRLSQISWPRDVTPRRTCVAGSNELFWTSRYSSSRPPIMPRSSASVLGRCVPSALNSVMFSRGTCASSASTAGRISSCGVARVMSEKMMPTRCSGRTTSRRGGAAIG